MVKIISDSLSGLAQARYPNRRNLFVDGKGDTYLHCIAGAGYVPGLRHGFLRVRAGEERFDPSYALDITSMILEIPGGLANHFNRVTYADGAILKALGNVPAFASSPPDEINDMTYHVFKVDLFGGTVEKLPFP